MSRFFGKDNDVFAQLKDKFHLPGQMRSNATGADDHGYFSDDSYEDYDDTQLYGYDADSHGSYTDYGEYAYNETADYADPYAGDYAYQNSSPVSTRPTYHTSEPSSPRLVSLDDVRAHLPIFDGKTPERSAGGKAHHSSSLHQTLHGDARAESRQAPGFNSLFSPTDVPADHTSQATVVTSQQTASFDPCRTHEGQGTKSFSIERTLRVLCPHSYDELESVARVLKARDVLVLDLRTTTPDLSKRILDFSFGASSVLDAQVDCVADKIFVICCGHALTDAEHNQLQGLGLVATSH